MDTNNYQLIQTIATIVSAVSGIVVVFIGILFKRYLDKKQRPRLVMLHAQAIGSDIKYLTPEYTHDNGEEVWIKVRVKNVSDAYAEDVELRVYSIKRENDSSVPLVVRSVPSFKPITSIKKILSRYV